MEKNIKLQVLRGVHAVESIDEIIDFVHLSEVVFLECITTTEVANDLEYRMNLVTSNEKYVSWLENNPSEMASDIFGWYMNIAWRLRLSNKRMVLVDKIDCVDQAEINRYMPGSILMSALVDNPSTLREDRYANMNKILSEEYEIIKYRNSLVIDQVCDYIDSLTDSDMDQVEPIQLSVVVGVIHDTESEFRKRLPGVAVEELFYATELTEQALNQPLVQLMMEKARMDGGVVGNKAIDYGLLGLFSSSAARSTAEKDGRTHTEKAIDIMHHGGVREHLSKAEPIGIKQIDEYSEDELRQLVDDIVERLDYGAS